MWLEETECSGVKDGTPRQLHDRQSRISPRGLVAAKLQADQPVEEGNGQDRDGDDGGSSKSVADEIWRDPWLNFS